MKYLKLPVYFLLMVVMAGCASSGRSGKVEKKEVSPVRQPAYPEVRNGTAKIIYSGSPGDEVYVAGDFTNWKKEKMTFEDGNFSVELELSPGKHPYKLVVNGDWIPDPRNPVTELDGYGGKNSVITVR